MKLIEEVRKWGRDRGINNPEKQYWKFLEEVGELARFTLLQDASDEKLAKNGLTRADVAKEITDAFGDIAVTIIILADINEDELSWGDNSYLYNVGNCVDKPEFSWLMEQVTPKWVCSTSLELLSYLAAEQRRSLEQCLEIAWQVIKNRKGNTINGNFIKE